MAVYTPLSDETISDALQAYGLGALQEAKGIAQGVENTNYAVTSLDGAGNHVRSILTLYEKRVKAEDLPFFMGLLQHLAQRGVPCPRPLQAKNGNLIHAVAGKPATFVTFLDGKEVKKIEPEHLHALGVHLAKLHLAAQDFALRRPNALSLEGWQQLAAKVAPRADTIVPGLSAIIAEELNSLVPHWKQNLPQGIIHADLFPDNVFFEGAELTGLIDFYFACNDTLMYDVAIVINAWCFEHQREFNITKARALLRGYYSVRALTQEELEYLPLLCRGAALRFLLTRTHDQLFPVEGAQVIPKDPMEYVRKLQFHQSVKHHGEYGL